MGRYGLHKYRVHVSGLVFTPSWQKAGKRARMLQNEIDVPPHLERIDRAQPADGQVHAVSAMTDEQRVEELTRQLEQVNHELRVFNYAISHDLRAPLRHINGFAEILSQEAGPALNEACRGYLTTICQSAAHMSQMIDGLLQLSRITYQPLAISKCRLRGLIDIVIGELRSELGQRDVQFQIGELPMVECDPGFMKRAFTNLLQNAIKFSCTRTPAIIEVGTTEDNGTVEIFIRDNGVGFDTKHAEKLFGPFQRFHSAKDFPGLGMGLAIAQRIVQRHGGCIRAEAAVNAGATFYVGLPTSALAEAIG